MPLRGPKFFFPYFLSVFPDFKLSIQPTLSLISFLLCVRMFGYQMIKKAVLSVCLLSKTLCNILVALSLFFHSSPVSFETLKSHMVRRTMRIEILKTRLRRRWWRGAGVAASCKYQDPSAKSRHHHFTSLLTKWLRHFFKNLNRHLLNDCSVDIP